MPLVNLVIILVMVGVILYMINRYIPMANSIKTILNILVVCVVAFGCCRPSDSRDLSPASG